MVSDAELLAAWRAGDLRAGNALFARHFPTVERFFANKTAASEIEDLVQQTFEACTVARDRYEGRAPFKVYLLRIARNKLYKHWSARAKNRTANIESLSLADLGAGPSTLLARNHDHKRLLDALRRLPLAQQELLELYFWEDLTGPQLGLLLGVPENTARTRVRRAKLALEAELHELERCSGIPESSQTNIDDWVEGIRGSLSARAKA